MSSLSPDDFTLLTDPQTEALVERHLDDDPVRLAFRLKGDREQARLVCQQVKVLQRAKAKLPSYYAARCIIPPISYEQSSSETAAGMKSYAGKLCIDLTCGLGVDAFHFSRSFDRVIAVERDPVLAEVARYNFDRLGAENITVVNASAEDFLAAYDGPEADLVYVDPARRSGGERVFLLEDCSPNVLEITSLLLQKAKTALVKLSPLFDVGEALRLFGPHVSKAEIVSIDGEVKELLVELTRSPERAEIAVSLGGGRSYRFGPEELADAPDEASGEVFGTEFLLIPDAAFYKGRLVKPLIDRVYPEQKIRLTSKNGFAFAEEKPEGFPGRVYRILDTMDYQPKKLKKELKTQGIARINILRRDFPFRSEEIKAALGIQEGGTRWFAFTEIAGKPTVFRVEPARF